MRKVAIPFAIVSVAALLIELAAPAMAPRLATDYGGLLERVFLASVLIWIGVVSFYMSRRVSGASSPPMGEAFSPN